MDTHLSCPARLWHRRHDDGSGELPTDTLAADVGSAIHSAVMEFQRHVEARTHRADRAQTERELDQMILRRLRQQGLDGTIPEVEERIRVAMPGLRRLTSLMIEELGTWARDPASNELLIWAEPRLDHGPGHQAVRLSSEAVMPTRPDILGLRMDRDLAIAVVRDVKVRNRPVAPEHDTGLLVRAMWAISEARRPRCRWFLGQRTLPVCTDVVEVETVNVLFDGTERFHIRRRLSVTWLQSERDRLCTELSRMAVLDKLVRAADVETRPGELCERWCPSLHRCPDGKAWVRKYRGDEVLAARLADAPSALDRSA